MKFREALSQHKGPVTGFLNASKDLRSLPRQALKVYPTVLTEKKRLAATAKQEHRVKNGEPLKETTLSVKPTNPQDNPGAPLSAGDARSNRLSPFIKELTVGCDIRQVIEMLENQVSRLSHEISELKSSRQTKSVQEMNAEMRISHFKALYPGHPVPPDVSSTVPAPDIGDVIARARAAAERFSRAPVQVTCTVCGSTDSLHYTSCSTLAPLRVWQATPPVVSVVESKTPPPFKSGYQIPQSPALCDRCGARPPIEGDRLCFTCLLELEPPSPLAERTPARPTTVFYFCTTCKDELIGTSDQQAPPGGWPRTCKHCRYNRCPYCGKKGLACKCQ